MIPTPNLHLRINLTLLFIFSFLIFFLSAFETPVQAQNPTPPLNKVPPRPLLYVLNLKPVNGGKSHNVFRNTKLIATLNNGTLIAGKVRGISKDSISIDYSNYAINSITNFKFNPGNTLGVIAAIGAVVGLLAIAFTIDKDRNSTQDAIFYTGIGLTAVSVALLIPNYFIKKDFPRTKYDYIPVPLAD